jgi:lipopolysaccharide transport system permease protein
LLLEVMLAVGLGFILATLGAYFRDLEHVLPSLLSINLYLLPIFFPKGAIPKAIQPLVEWNPFTPVVQLFQDVLVHGDIGSPKNWILTAGMALASMEFGYRLFRRARGGFGDIV